MKMTVFEKSIIAINSIIGLTIVVAVILDMTSLKDSVNLYFLIALGVEAVVCITCLILNTWLKNAKRNKFFKEHKTLA
jgi:uncharacterized membrane protein